MDSTQIRADASPDRTITPEQLPEVAKVNRTVREYVEQVERENVIAEPAQAADPFASEAEDKLELRRTYRNSPPMKISTTDPEAALSSKRGASEFAYYDNYLIFWPVSLPPKPGSRPSEISPSSSFQNP